MGGGNSKNTPILAYRAPLRPGLPDDEARERDNNELTVVEGPMEPIYMPDLTMLLHLDMSNSRIMSLNGLAMRNLSEIRYLDLSRNELRELPTELCLLPLLVRLDLSRNKLTQLPAAIGMLHDLSELVLDSNQLTELPDSLYELRQLTKLSIAHNQISRLSHKIGQLTMLIALHVDGNPLKALPSETGLLPLLRHLSSANCKFYTDRDCQQIQDDERATRRPPSLAELAARVIVRHSIPYRADPGDDKLGLPASKSSVLPTAVCQWLERDVQHCAACGGPFFDYRVTRYRFVNRNFVSIPLEFALCQAHWNTDSERIASLFKPRPSSTPRRVQVAPVPPLEPAATPALCLPAPSAVGSSASGSAATESGSAQQSALASHSASSARQRRMSSSSVVTVSAPAAIKRQRGRRTSLYSPSAAELKADSVDTIPATVAESHAE